MKSIKAIISSLRVAMTDARQNESHFESWMILNEAICDAIDALAEQPAQPQQEPDDFDVWKARALQAEAVIAKFMEQPQPAQQEPVGKVNELFDEAVIEQCGFDRELLVYTSPPPQRKPMTDEQIEKLREKTFSTGNPYCPVDSKSMRKAARAIEAAHGIKENT